MGENLLPYLKIEADRLAHVVEGLFLGLSLRDATGEFGADRREASLVLGNEANFVDHLSIVSSSTGRAQSTIDAQSQKKLSKSLSLVLRHQPESVGLTLDEAGWVEVDRLLAAMNLERATLESIVRESDKQRFALDASGTRIRANQGHSVQVDLGLETTRPPDVLYHGTPEDAVAAILAEGLHRMARHAVHLSPDPETAARVGARRGKPVVLRIDARAMAEDGFAFTLSDNGVWLVDYVPSKHVARNV